MPSYQTLVVYPLKDNTQTQFSVPFPVDHALSEVAVMIDDRDVTIGWVYNQSASNVTFQTAPSGKTLVLRRKTKTDSRVVSFQSRSTLSEAELNRNANQLFFALQEIEDTYNLFRDNLIGYDTAFRNIESVVTAAKNMALDASTSAAASAASCGTLYTNMTVLWAKLTGDDTLFENAFVTAQELMEAKGAIDTAAAAAKEEVNVASQAALEVAKLEIEQAKESSLDTLTQVTGTSTAEVSLLVSQAVGANGTITVAKAAAETALANAIKTAQDNVTALDATAQAAAQSMAQSLTAAQTTVNEHVATAKAKTDEAVAAGETALAGIQAALADAQAVCVTAKNDVQTLVTTAQGIVDNGQTAITATVDSGKIAIIGSVDSGKSTIVGLVNNETAKLTELVTNGNATLTGVVNQGTLDLNSVIGDETTGGIATLKGVISTGTGELGVVVNNGKTTIGGLVTNGQTVLDGIVAGGQTSLTNTKDTALSEITVAKQDGVDALNAIIGSETTGGIKTLNDIVLVGSNGLNKIVSDGTVSLNVILDEANTLHTTVDGKLTEANSLASNAASSATAAAGSAQSALEQAQAAASAKAAAEVAQTAAEAAAGEAGSIVNANVGLHNENANAHSALFAQKAPLESPVFTGIPKTPTPANADVTEQIVNISYLNGRLQRGMQSPVNIGGGTDANDYYLPGCYYIASNSEASAMAHLPTGLSGSLRVYVNNAYGDGVTQVYTDYVDNHTWTRSYVRVTGWTPWRKNATAGEWLPDYGTGTILNYNTEYTAAVDGYLLIRPTSNTAPAAIFLIVNGSSVKTGYTTEGTNPNTQYGSLFPIRSGDVYQVTCSAECGTDDLKFFNIRS